MALRTRKRWALLCLLLGAGMALCGCKTLGFYSQAIRGQYQILSLQEPIAKLKDAPSTPEKLRQRFVLLENLRAFSEHQLHLPVDGHYLKYADLGRPFVVWNVEAAPEFSMAPKGWWYPLVGKLEYRGYFAESNARKYADSLRRQGFDVQIGGVTAYSTLGWFRDPVLNTFIFDEDMLLADTIFHELAHQRLFAPGDKDFNEAYATCVGREGVRRWLHARNDGPTLARYEIYLRHEDEFSGLVDRTRAKLEKLYGDVRTEEGKVRASKRPSSLTSDQLRTAKQTIFEEMRLEYSTLKTNWPAGENSRDWWFQRPLNNAKLNSVSAYYQWVPSFEKLLDLNSGRMEAFHLASERLAKMSKKDRYQWLENLRALGTNAPPKSASHPLLVEPTAQR